MSEQRITSEIQQPGLPLPRTFDLGQHTLEVLDDQAMILVSNEQMNAMVHLSKDETYRLGLVLRDPFWLEIHNGKDNTGIMLGGNCS